MARILVLGAGFAGLWAAVGAARKLDEIGVLTGEVEILVVDRNPYHNIRVRNYDLFAASNRRLGVTFDWIVTAQQAESYKPSHRNFELAFERIGGPRERILHVAQSLYHDHVPAKELGLQSVWINRRAGREGSGATPPAAAAPDATFPDMASFAESALSLTPALTIPHEAAPSGKKRKEGGPTLR